MIRDTALGVAIAEVDHRVSEVGGNNRGPRIRRYLENCDPPIGVAAPWCAAFVQYCADLACTARGLQNPLNGVALEAYVQSYFDWATEEEAFVAPDDAQPGDLALFDFRGVRWDHVGFVLTPVGPRGGFRTIEGNTGDRSQRDGDGVFEKPRRVGASYPVAFVRWAP